MRRHRTARGVFGFFLVALTTVALATPAAGEEKGAVPRLVFPLVAKTELWDNYGDPRGNGRHAGIDMENPWRSPVVAVEEGKVEYASSGLGGCMLYLYGASGTMYLYIHLNNDLTARNDNKGGCVKDTTFAVSNGARVTAGELIAYNGDSGDAYGNPHLHFEVHPNGGVDVNPFRHLKRAVRPLFAAKRGTPFALGLRGKLVASDIEAVALEVERVRFYPGGLWLEIEQRSLELSVPIEASIAPGLGNLSRRAYAPPLAVTAFTTKAKATREAIVGAPGVLQLRRIAPAR
jgi:hypothetical protein